MQRVERLDFPGLVVIRVLLDPEGTTWNERRVASVLMEAPECRDLIELFCSDACRGVSADRLSQVLDSGIDVEPASGVIWVSSLEKALEYGAWPKLVLLLDRAYLDATFRELGPGWTERERSELLEVFPTELPSVDGASRWFTRLPPDDRRAASGYEMAYARWIPRDADRALLGLVVVEQPSVGARLDWRDLIHSFRRASARRTG